MDYTALISRIRGAARDLGFESPTRGAVVLRRLSYGLPASELLQGESELDRALEVLYRTIAHSHGVHGVPDQWGNGYLVMFSRHVIEDDQRWDVEVDVRVDLAEHAMIEDVRIVRPGDDEDGEKGDGDGKEREAKSARPTTGLSMAELLPFGMIGCPCCGHATLTERGEYDICPVCFWEDQGQDNQAIDEVSGPNHITLREGRVSFLRIGACDERVREHVRQPTAEEVQLRRFGSDGDEIAAE